MDGSLYFGSKRWEIKRALAKLSTANQFTQTVAEYSDSKMIEALFELEPSIKEIEPTSKLAAIFFVIQKKSNLNDKAKVLVQDVVQLDEKREEETVVKLLKRYSAYWIIRLFTGELGNEQVSEVRELLAQYNSTDPATKIDYTTLLKGINNLNSDPLNDLKKIIFDLASATLKEFKKLRDDFTNKTADLAKEEEQSKEKAHQEAEARIERVRLERLRQEHQTELESSSHVVGDSVAIAADIDLFIKKLLKDDQYLSCHQNELLVPGWDPKNLYSQTRYIYRQLKVANRKEDKDKLALIKQAKDQHQKNEEFIRACEKLLSLKQEQQNNKQGDGTSLENKVAEVTNFDPAYYKKQLEEDIADLEYHQNLKNDPFYPKKLLAKTRELKEKLKAHYLITLGDEEKTKLLHAIAMQHANNVEFKIQYTRLLKSAHEERPKFIRYVKAVVSLMDLIVFSRDSKSDKDEVEQHYARLIKRKENFKVVLSYDDLEYLKTLSFDYASFLATGTRHLPELDKHNTVVHALAKKIWLDLEKSPHELSFTEDFKKCDSECAVMTQLNVKAKNEGVLYHDENQVFGSKVVISAL